MVSPSAHLHDVSLGTQGNHLGRFVASHARAVAERSQQSAAPGQDVAIAHQRYAMQLAGGYLRDGRRREHTLRRRRIRVVAVAENAVLAAAPAKQHS